MAATKTPGSATLADATAAFAAEGCSSPHTWGNGRRRHVRAPRPRLPQGAVLPGGLDRVPHGRRGHRTARGRPAGPGAGHGARGDRRARWVPMRRGVQVKVAFHVDQLWFKAPGGIGTYVREMLDALPAEDPALELVPFRCDARPLAQRRSTARVARRPVVLASRCRARSGRCIRRGTPSAGPRSRASLDDVDDRPRDEPRRGASGPRRSAARGDRPRPGVRTVPRAVPARLAMAVPRRGCARRRNAPTRSWSRRRARRRSDGVDVDPGVAGARHAARARRSSSSDEDPAGTVFARLGVTRPYVLSVGTLEPRKNLVRLVRAYRQVAPDVPHALVLAGAPGWRSDALDAELARTGPGDGRADGLALWRATSTCCIEARTCSPIRRCTRGSGCRSLEAMARGVPDARLQHVVAPRGRRRRRAPGGPDGRLGDRRGTRDAC